MTQNEQNMTARKVPSKLSESLLKIQEVERDWSQIKQNLNNNYTLNRTLDLTRTRKVHDFNATGNYNSIGPLEQEKSSRHDTFA